MAKSKPSAVRSYLLENKANATKIEKITSVLPEFQRAVQDRASSTDACFRTGRREVLESQRAATFSDPTIRTVQALGAKPSRYGA